MVSSHTKRLEFIVNCFIILLLNFSIIMFFPKQKKESLRKFLSSVLLICKLYIWMAKVEHCMTWVNFETISAPVATANSNVRNNIEAKYSILKIRTELQTAHCLKRRYRPFWTPRCRYFFRQWMVAWKVYTEPTTQVVHFHQLLQYIPDNKIYYSRLTKMSLSSSFQNHCYISAGDV